MVDRDTITRYRFFREHTGYVVSRRAQSALSLARAEKRLGRALELGIAEIVWDWDDIPYDQDIVSHEEAAAKFESNEWTGPFYCLLKINGETAGTLGGIVVGPRELDDPYCRVVVAELADEAEDELRQAIGDLDARDEIPA